MSAPTRILNFVGDQPNSASSLLAAENVQCEEIVVRNLKAFAKALKQGKIDLILSDYHLGDCDGLEALALARAVRPQIPFLFMSDKIGEETAVETLKQGAADFVLKENPARLAVAVRRALSSKVAKHRPVKNSEATVSRGSVEHWKEEWQQSRASLRSPSGRADAAALESGREQLQLVARAVEEAVWDWNIQTNSLWFSEGFRVFGYAPEEVEPTFAFWLERVHPEDQGSLHASIGDFLASGKSVWSGEYRFRKKDGNYVCVADQGYAIRDGTGKAIRMLGSMADVSERKKAQDSFQRLTEHIVNAQEAERKRVARELHDGVSQMLCLAKSRIQALEQDLSGENAKASRRSMEARQFLEKALAEVRSISRNLLPSELEDLGLVRAVRSLCSDFEHSSGIRVQLICDRISPEISAHVSLQVFRAIQEALNNIEKHSRATSAVIKFHADKSELLVNIQDNGSGFATKSRGGRASRKPGMGLINMRQRIAAAGGRLEIISTPGAGTTVQMRIPLDNLAKYPTPEHKHYELNERKKHQRARG